MAYVRFASVYREFQDITDFADALKAMLPREQGAKGKGRKQAARRGSGKGGSKKRS